MNTTTKATRIGIAAAIATITFAAAACGTEEGTSADATERQSAKTTPSTEQSRTSADAAERRGREREERAEWADAKRSLHGN